MFNEFKYFEGRDLLKLATDYTVDTEYLTEEQKEELGVYDDDAYIVLDESSIEDMDIPYEAVDWTDPEWNDDSISGIMKDSAKYLVFAYGCRWNGASGYKFADTFRSALARDYDVSLVAKAVSKGGKALYLSESSHDVPMGAPTVIVALTNREYDSLCQKDFDGVKAFADTYYTRLLPF